MDHFGKHEFSLRESHAADVLLWVVVVVIVVRLGCAFVGRCALHNMRSACLVIIVAFAAAADVVALPFLSYLPLHTQARAHCIDIRICWRLRSSFDLLCKCQSLNARS